MAETDPDYGKFDEEEYIVKINSPSQSRSYFERFHKPLIEEAKKMNVGKKVRVLDVGCGHGHELDFLKSDPSVQLIGTDVSVKTLAQSTRNRLKDATVQPLLIASDVEQSPFAENSVDVGIAVNAMIYKPDQMLSCLFNALKPGAKCAVNFRSYWNPRNRPFFDINLMRSCSINNQVLEVGDESFALKVVDYRGCGNPQCQSLGQQAYFQYPEDMERFIREVGFNIIGHETFRYASPDNPDGNEIDVYTMKKPEGEE